MPTTLTFERQKMSVEIWEKLKNHIMKQREKRKQEQEQDAEQERHRREQELKRKRDATTLDEIKDQLSKLESNLSELHKQKHELFVQLKKVLHEDDARKRHQENEIMLAARQAALQHAQSQNNQQYPFFLPNNTVTPNNSRLNSNQPQPTQQQLTNAMQQQQLSKHSPITTISNLSTQPNYIHSNSNTVIKQPPSAHQQSQQQQQQQQLNTSTNKQKANLKRPLERSSPQSFNNILPNSSFSKAPTLSTAYTPSVSRIPTTSQQAFFPTQPNRHLSIPVSQPSLSSGQLNFDTKTNPYLSNFLQDAAAHAAVAEHANLLNAQLNPQQLNPQQMHQFQQHQELYQQQLLKMTMTAGLQIPMQNAALKNQSGSITSGFPMQRLPTSTPTSMNNSNKFNQNNRYNMF